MRTTLGRLVWLPLFLIWCFPSASQEASVCEKAQENISRSDHITLQLVGPLEKLLNDNKLIFSDPDTFERTMQTWDSRLKWSQHNLASLKRVFADLSSKRNLRLVVVSYEQITIVFKPAEAEQGLVQISLTLRMHPQSETMVCSGESCGQWFVSPAATQPSPIPFLVSKTDAMSVIRTAGKALCFRLAFIFSENELPKKDDFWGEPQALEISKFDQKIGDQIGTGQFMPDSYFIRLREVDFSELEKGRMTKDFMSNPAANPSPKATGLQDDQRRGPSL